MSKYLENTKIILASKSPRRQQLLKELGINFEILTNGEEDESFPDHLSMTEIPVYLAKNKAKPHMNSLSGNDILITSDTIVWCQGQVINKPADANDAYRILRLLSGCKHVVVTGIAITSKSKQSTLYDCTDVYFRDLADEEIWFYINNYKPFDKAGAYGIQEWIGFIGIERIDGSYFNVMGFPIQKFYTELLTFLRKNHS